MRTLAATLVALLLVLGGCGDGEDGSPLDNALGYLPADAPLALIVSTDLESEQYRTAREVLDEIPLGPLLLGELESELEGGDVSFDDDVRPLLGNEIVVGVAQPQSLLAEDVEGFVAALETRGGEGLADLVRRLREDDTFAAADGDVLVIADTEEGLQAALDQRGAGDRLREDAVRAAFEDLPDDAPARIYGNLAALLEADPSTAPARRVPFVDALETFAATVRLEERGGRVALDFALNAADGAELEEGELPLAAGEESPPVIGGGAEIGTGIRDPARVVRFAEAVGQAVSPERFAEYQTAKRQISQGLGVDLDRDVFAQFTGAASFAIDPEGNFGVRSELANPRAFERTLDRLVRVIPSFAEGAGFGDVGVARPGEGEDFYAVAGEGGGGIVYGVVDGVFVLANDARRAADLASERPRPVQGAEGAVVARADAGELARMLIGRLAGIGSLPFELPLGLLTGSVKASEDGLRGRLALELEREGAR